jgi:hypothetical protein
MADAPWCAVAARLFAVSHGVRSIRGPTYGRGCALPPGVLLPNWRGLTAPPLSHSYATHHSELKQQIAQV